MSWFAELRRRRVFRTVAVYLVAAWLLIQVAGATFEQIGLPGWTVTLVIVLLALGLPLAIGMAWAFDVGPRGIRHTEPAGSDAGASQASGTVASAPLPAPAEAPTTASRAAVAVLPFVDMSAARDQEHFGDGIAEEIINALCCVRDLRVASRTSSFQFKSRAADVRDIGRALRVGSVLEGSVRCANQRIRVTAQLVDANDGFHLWSESFDRRLEDVFALQTEIARSIVHALKVSLTPAEERRMDRGGTESPRAYELFLRARQLLRDHSDTSMIEAEELARSAIEADPRFALAHATFANAIATAKIWNVPGLRERTDEAMEAAERAERIQPDLPEAMVARANLLSSAGRTTEAVAAFEAAIAANPRSFDAHMFYARHAFGAGQHDLAVRLFERAHELEPADYQSAAWLSMSYRKVGNLSRFEQSAREALEGVERRLRLHPNDSRALHLGATTYASIGDRERAIELTERALALRPTEFATLYNSACTFALVGERERALQLVERFLETGGGSASWIAEDPDFDSIRDEPRFAAVLRSLSTPH